MIGSDGDLELINAYLMGELPEAEAMAFEERLVTDHDFYSYAGPLIKIWRMPLKWGELLDARAAERPHPGRVREPTSAYVFDRSAAATISPEPAPETGIPVLALPSEAQPLTTKESEKLPWDRKVMDFIFEGGWTMTKIFAALWIGVVMPFVYYDQWIEKPRDAVVTVVQNDVPATVLPGSTLIETKPGEVREFILKGGSRVVLRDGSRFWYKYFGLPQGVSGTLQGELAVELNTHDRPFMLSTALGRVLFTAGSYAVRCAAACGTMLVVVGATGYAGIFSSDTTKPMMSVMKNERGALQRGGAPQKITGDNGLGWPELLAPLAGAKQ